MAKRHHGLHRGAALAASALIGSTIITAPVSSSALAAASAGKTSTAAPAAAVSALRPPRPPQPRVLTLEGGIVGLQHFIRFTPLILRGEFCDKPGVCKAVDYPALPGDIFNEIGADRVEAAIRRLPKGTPITLLGFSQGGEVIYAALREWQKNPQRAPDPALVSWVSAGNPENPLGGVTTRFGFAQPQPRVPADTPYKGIGVIRQYDGWADAPNNLFNLLAVLNAIIGSQVYHLDYGKVDLDDPENVRYTPKVNGRPGNITYVYVPAPTIPLVIGMGPFAPALDRLFRPIIERAYNRPVEIPNPNALPPRSAASASPGHSEPASPAGLISVPSGHSDSAEAPSAVSSPTSFRSPPPPSTGTQPRLPIEQTNSSAPDDVPDSPVPAESEMTDSDTQPPVETSSGNRDDIVADGAGVGESAADSASERGELRVPDTAGPGESQSSRDSAPESSRAGAVNDSRDGGMREDRESPEGADGESGADNG